jgi:deoxyribose-phosphate aldolase
MNFSPYHQDAETLSERIQWITNKPITDFDLKAAYRTIFNCIDLTTLEGSDNTQKIKQLCAKALDFGQDNRTGAVAAVCVYMPFVRQAKFLLQGSGVEVATVACAFPSGQLPLHLKLAEVAWVAEEGADEIDMVISRGKMLEGDYDAVLQEIQAVKAACGKARLKVILETGELKSIELIRKASELALLGGADFLKTSTGKVNPAATPEAVVIMLDSIKEFYLQTGKQVGLKPAGGIAEPEDALVYYKLVAEIVGEHWLSNRWFRIGASRLADKLQALLLT